MQARERAGPPGRRRREPERRIRYDIVCDVTALVPYDITYDSRLLFTVDVIYVMSYMISYHYDIIVSMIS